MVSLRDYILHGGVAMTPLHLRFWHTKVPAESGNVTD